MSDIATIELRSTQRSSYRRLNGEEAVIINALRAPGVNVVETMIRLRAAIDKLNETVLASRASTSALCMTSKYIASAIDLVQQNIWIGGMLAQRAALPAHRAATVIVFAAIPVSVIGTFVAIAGLGLSINVISLLACICRGDD